MLEMLFAMLEEERKARAEEEVKEEPTQNEKEEKGFTSLIPEGVEPYIDKCLEAHKELADYMLKNVNNVMATIDTVPLSEKYYTMLEFMMFSDFYRQCTDLLIDCRNIKEVITKKEIDKLCAERGLPVELIVKEKLLSGLLR